jgi:hypothetical protein
LVLAGLHWGLPAELSVLHAVDRGIVGHDGEAVLSRARVALADLDPHRTWRPSVRMGPASALLLAVTAWRKDTPSGPDAGPDLAPLQARLAAFLTEAWDRAPTDRSDCSPLGELIFPAQALAALALAAHAADLHVPAPAAVEHWKSSPSSTCRAERLVRVVMGCHLGPPSEPSTTLGLLGVIDECLLMRESSDGGPAMGVARRAAGAVLARRHHAGRWFPEDAAPDRYRLSALWGLAAVAHAFCGLAAPERWHSLRMLGWSRRLG